MHTFLPNTNISVIIVNWNSWDILSTCLEKLQHQTFKNFNVIVFDNASSTHAPANLYINFPEVSIIHSETNLGFAAANNQALQHNNSTWVALLNPDAFPEPDWLEQLINSANQNPEYAIFGSRQLMDGNQDLLDGEGDIYHISGLVWRSNHGKYAYKANHNPHEVFSACAAAALYRRDTLIEVGGFDEDFFCYVEDVDLGFRLRLMGYRCLLVPDAIVHHIGSATTGGQRSDFSVYHGHRNLVWTFVKNMPGWLFWALLPLHIVMNCATICVFTLRGQGRVILKAKIDAIKGIPLMWAKRKQIQKARIANIKSIWQVLDKRLVPRK